MKMRIFLPVLTALALVLTSVNQISAQKIQPSALRQIQSLIDEKESRTPAQKKMDSQLWYAIKEGRGDAITSEVATLEINVRKDNNGRVPVDIRGNVTSALIKAVNDAGGEIIFKSENLNTINARIPLPALEQIAALDDVRFIYPADRAFVHKDAEASGFTNPENKFFDNFLRVNSKSKLDALAIYSRKIFLNSNKSKLDKGNEATIPFKFDFSPTKSSHVDFAARAARVRKQLSNALSDKKFRTGLPTGPINSQGDVTHRAGAARSFFGVNGSGVKIGVLSDGVTSLAAQQGAGELPAVTVLPGQAGSGDEGTAMLEIIYDLAPGAQLYFATAFTSQASFAQNILDLRTAGCDIIVDDVAYFREAVFQDDNVALSVNTVTAAGALYFSSAGNEGNKDDNTSGVWEGDFVDAGTGTVGAVTLVGGTVHNFGGGVLNDQLTVANGGAPIGLFWSDQLGASGNDYDLYILDAGLTVVVSAATNVQDGNDDPVELSTISPGAGRRFVIFKKTAAAARALHLNTFRGRLALSTTGQTHGHSSAVDAFSVAATPAAAAIGAPPNPTGPFPGVFNSANVTELFSSDGPRRMFYNPNGTAITPGNFLFGTGGGNVRQKPDITAADGTASGVAGFNPFFGTSAAAPHAAAIAGLVKSALPALTPAQIRTALITSAIDIEAAGYDRDAGSGIVMAYEALLAAGAPPAPFIVSGGATLVSESCPPANIVIDPGETVTVSFCVQNTGGANTTNLVGTLQASGGVTSPSGPQNYGIVVAGGPVVCRNFTFTASGACGSTITASIQFQDGVNNLGTITYTFTLGVATNTTSTFSNPTAITIPTSGAATPYPSNILVSGLTGTVNKVTVNLTGLNHTFPEDVGMLLVGPGGQKFVILDGVIGGTPWVNINYTLDDAAATTIPKPGTPISGIFKPSCYFSGDVFPAPAPGGANQQPAPAGSATFASVFNGTNPNGTWSLYVFDFAAGDGGSVSGGWGLNITTSNYTCCTPPTCTLTCPANITVPNDPNQCGAVVTYPAPTTTGTCGIVTASPASGSFFPVGTTTVTATSSIGGGTCTFTVTVNDTQPPTITCPANITVSNNLNQCGAVVNYPAPTVSDNCPGVTVVSSPASGSFFPRGTTTVTATATDGSGNISTCTFTVTVNDTQPPTITCPANIALCGGSQVVNYPPPTASDNCPGVIVVSVPASGSVFPVGVTTVTATATDASGNTASCTFTITIYPIPTVNPVPNQTVCNAVPTSPIIFSGPVPGTQFTWTNSNPAIGLAASGSGNIASFIPVNPGPLPITATITVTPFTNSSLATIVFNYTGAVQNFVVPAGVTSVNIQALGGQGNANASGVNLGGLGGSASGTLAVTPGETLFVYVGGGGVTNITGGFNGGGNGGNTGTCLTAPGGGGGGASDVRQGANTLAARKIVAGGGGGTAGNRVVGCARGAGGGGGGGYYGGGGGCGYPGTTGTVPTGGTQVGGGAGGITGTAFGATNGLPGVSGIGGAGGNEIFSNQGGSQAIIFGSGVGGGLTGGSGQQSGLNDFTGQSGAGGSSYTGGVTAGVTVSGQRSGNGTVSISYVSAAPPVICTGPPTTFTITVNPSPRITCPANITVNNTAGLCGAIVNYPPAVGVGPPAPVITYNFPSGSFFPVGTTTVVATATNVCGVATCSFTVTVVDVEPPVIICPANITRNNDPGLCSAVVTYPLPTVTDNCPNAIQFPASFAAHGGGTVFSLSGNTLPGGLFFTLTNNSALARTVGSFGVRFGDPAFGLVTAPQTLTIWSRPGGLTTAIENSTAGWTAQGPQVVNPIPPYFPTGTGPLGICGMNSSVVIAPGASASFFIHGQTACPIFNYNFGFSPPIVNSGFTMTGGTISFDVLGSANHFNQGVVNGIINIKVNYTEGIGPPILIAGLASGSVFPVGTTTNTYRATDAAGNTATCSFNVTVVDAQPPTLSCPANIVRNTDPGLCTATVATPNPTVSDNCALTQLTWAMTGATIASSPATGINFVGTRTFNLSGTTGQGVTTITYTARDAAGNTSTCSFTVTVNDALIPVITLQPATRFVCAGSPGVFSVTATAGGGPLSYQWQEWNGTAWVNIAGATASTFTVPGVTFADNTRSFRVILTGLCSVVTSGVATLYVNPLPTITLLTSIPPSLLPGQFLTITATGTPAGGTFAWYKNGSLTSHTGSSWSGLTVDDIGTYKVVYTDPNGCVQTSSDVVVSGQPSTGLWVYPNPNTGQFLVRMFNQLNESITVRVYDAKGAMIYRKVVVTGTPYTGIDVDLGALLPGGVYIVDVRNSSGKLVGARKIIVRHP